MNPSSKFGLGKTPYSAVDIIIKYNYGLVLIERSNVPLGLALPGGVADYGLSYEQNAVKEAREETGLEVRIETPEHPLCVYSSPDRDQRAHIATHVYTAVGRGMLKAGSDAKRARVYTLGEVINLLGKNKFAFPDHERSLAEYLRMEGNVK